MLGIVFQEESDASSWQVVNVIATWGRAWFRSSSDLLGAAAWCEETLQPFISVDAITQGISFRNGSDSETGRTVHVLGRVARLEPGSPVSLASDIGVIELFRQQDKP